MCVYLFVNLHEIPFASKFFLRCIHPGFASPASVPKVISMKKCFYINKYTEGYTEWIESIANVWFSRNTFLSLYCASIIRTVTYSIFVWAWTRRFFFYLDSLINDREYLLTSGCGEPWPEHSICPPVLLENSTLCGGSWENTGPCKSNSYVPANEIQNGIRN